MSDKPKFPRHEAIAAAKDILASFLSDRVVIAGSLRRRKMMVGDIEIVYIPRVEKRPDTSDLFAQRSVETNLSDISIGEMITKGVIRPRENALNRTTWGDKNKLALHIASSIPVDFFATTERAWWNYLVCRTGGAETNTRIASAAQRKGWKWHPYSWGFTDQDGRPVEVTSERDVFTLVDLKYLEPWERS
jgi:DNA polymerase/3'-5' exonuclease PolX